MILVTIFKNYIHYLFGGAGRYSCHSMCVGVIGHPYTLDLAFYYVGPRGQTEVAVLNGKQVPVTIDYVRYFV